MHRILEWVTTIFEPLHHGWEGRTMRRLVAWVLSLSFVVSLALIELNRQGWMPSPLSSLLPTNPFLAVHLAFSLVLIIEVVALIFTLPCSVTRSVGKQLEILSLILLRNSFKELDHFDQASELAGDAHTLALLVAYGVSALAIFALVGLFYRMHGDSSPILSGENRFRFVATKKIISLFLFAGFIVAGIMDLWFMVTDGPVFDFFISFYSVLIFSDILIVLISQRYLPSFHAVFRNSGYALSTLLMRLALSAPAYYDAALGVVAAGYTVLLTLIYNAFARTFPD